MVGETMSRKPLPPPADPLARAVYRLRIGRTLPQVAALLAGVGCPVSHRTVKHWLAGTRTPQLVFRVLLPPALKRLRILTAKRKSDTRGTCT